MTDRIPFDFDWYVSGPMTGMPNYNFPEFNRVTKELEALGYRVSNPAAKGELEGWTWADYLRWDLAELIRCRGIVNLDGWEHSEGACLENHVANKLGMTIVSHKEILK